MKSTLSKEIDSALTSVLDTKSTNLHINICHESDMEEFFKLEREGVCRYYLKN